MVDGIEEQFIFSQDVLRDTAREANNFYSINDRFRLSLCQIVYLDWAIAGQDLEGLWIYI